MENYIEDIGVWVVLLTICFLAGFISAWLGVGVAIDMAQTFKVTDFFLLK
ncbi:MAG: hypothetical protein IJV75_00300 [Alphaproteobacteria bacterium]|nr:hypothetical protein [Alphaproteobacteria bacterium]